MTDITVHAPKKTVHASKLLVLGVMPGQEDLSLLQDLKNNGWTLGLLLLKAELPSKTSTRKHLFDIMVSRPHCKTASLFQALLEQLKGPSTVRIFIDILSQGGIGPAGDKNFYTVELPGADGVMSDHIADAQSLSLANALTEINTQGASYVREKPHAKPYEIPLPLQPLRAKG